MLAPSGLLICLSFTQSVRVVSEQRQEKTLDLVPPVSALVGRTVLALGEHKRHFCEGKCLRNYTVFS